MGVRLAWDGRPASVQRLHLPLQTVEVVGSPRADRGTIFEAAGGREDGWRNRLIWGDNLHVLSSLADELAGQVDLIYIDPPFDSRQDYKVRIGIGDGTEGADADLSKISSVVEEKAYRDTWGRGVESYLEMLHDRLVILRELLSDRGSLFLHLAPNVSHYARVLLEEIFGPENFRAEIIWQRTTAHADTKDFGLIHDVVACFSKTSRHHWNPQFRPYDESYIKSHYSYLESDGRRYRLSDLRSPSPRPNLQYEWRGYQPHPNGWVYSPARMQELHDQNRLHYPNDKRKRVFLKRYLEEMPGMPLGDVWDDVFPINPQAKERLGYDTQKPEALLERIIKSSSDEDSIVLDCFAGSGTTAAVAEKLGRRWVAVDIGRFAIHTTRKRLLDVPGCKPFEVANLGRYERQVWQQETTGEQYAAYLTFLVELYGATVTTEFQHVHGTLAGAAVHVGAVDAPVTFAEIKEALDEARSAGFPALDVLGWEWELGLNDVVQEEAKSVGISLRLRRIPKEVMDPRAVASGEIPFHELAYVRLETTLSDRTVAVSLVDFALPSPELIAAEVREKIGAWSDYVDYWAVDFSWGGEGDTFRNAWQSYRTRGDRSLELTAHHDYDAAGPRTVLVKVVDVFGNDTTTAVSVTVG